MAGPSFWRSKSFRAAAVQAGFVAALIALILGAALTARANLAAQGLTSGFGFLWKATGWEINFTLLPATTADPYWWYLVLGLMNTLFMGVIGLVGASALGLVVGLMRSGRNPAARLLGTIYIEIFRNLPLILQLFFWYAMANALPAPRQSIGFAGALINARGISLPGLTVGPGTVALAVLALVVAAGLVVWLLTARRFRRMEPARLHRMALGLGAAGLAVAALTLVAGHDPAQPWITRPELGLSPWQVFSRVRMPLAFRAMLPILINQYVWLIKATTLGIAVGFSDFFMVIASSINHSGQTFEFIAILMGGFLLINFSLAAVLNRLNRAIALKGHQTTGAI